MSAPGKAADQPPRVAMNVALIVRQRLFATSGVGLAFEEQNGQRSEQAEIARGGGVAHRAAVLVLGAIPAIVLPIFDAPMSARQYQQVMGVGLLGVIGGDGKAGVIGFLDDSASVDVPIGYVVQHPSPHLIFVVNHYGALRYSMF